MSTAQDLTESPFLSPSDRRKLARHLFELEQAAQSLAEGDARADTNFQTLDALEAEARVA